MAADITVDVHPPTDADERLIESATNATRQAFDPDRWDGAHIVGAAVRTADGDVFTGVSMPASVGRASMCAEPVALGSALAAGKREFEAIVAVRHPLPDEDRDFEVVPACGVCRELVADYGEDVRVVVPHDDGLGTVRAIELLPTRTW